MRRMGWIGRWMCGLALWLASVCASLAADEGAREYAHQPDSASLLGMGVAPEGVTAPARSLLEQPEETHVPGASGESLLQGAYLAKHDSAQFGGSAGVEASNRSTADRNLPSRARENASVQQSATTHFAAAPSQILTAIIVIVCLLVVLVSVMLKARRSAQDYRSGYEFSAQSQSRTSPRSPGRLQMWFLQPTWLIAARDQVDGNNRPSAHHILARVRSLRERLRPSIKSKRRFDQHG